MLDDLQSSCCGETFAQCHAIVEIGRTQSISLNNLADVLGLDKNTMNRTINNLVEKDLAVRKLDPEDRRYIAIQLTAKGMQSFREIKTTMEAYFTQIYQSIPEAKRDQIIESLHLLVRALLENDCCKRRCLSRQQVIILN